MTIKDIVQKGREADENIKDIDWEYIYELKRIKSSELTPDDFECASHWLPDKLKSHIDSRIIEVLEGVLDEGIKRSWDESGKGDSLMTVDDFSSLITSVIDEIKK